MSILTVTTETVEKLVPQEVEEFHITLNRDDTLKLLALTGDIDAADGGLHHLYLALLKSLRDSAGRLPAPAYRLEHLGLATPRIVRDGDA